MTDLKNTILKNISQLPLPLSSNLLKCNFLSSNVYGNRYKKYLSDRIVANYNKYDNSSLVIDIVNNAILKVPFFKEQYVSPVVSERDFQERKIFINKEIVMHHFNDFIDPDIDIQHYITGTTGGTSGKPLKLIIPKDRHIFELATMHSMWQIAGWRYHKRAVLRNHHLPEEKVYIINPITKEYIFDNFRMNDEYMFKVYNVLKNNNIKYIHAYPSAAYQFSVFLKENNLDTTFINAFLSGSENIFDHQKELITNSLGIRFYNWYGHSEKLVLGGYCKHVDHYHIEPTYGYFELIDESGEVITTPGKIGEIVGTTLHNPGMPLIRYRTGDFAEYVGNRCYSCGRELPVIKNIKGRWSGEKVYNKDGTYVTTTALNLHNDLYGVINGHQYVQQEYGALDVLIIKSAEYSTAHEERILDHYKSKFKSDTKINIKYVDQLIYQPNGKYLHLISEA